MAVIEFKEAQPHATPVYSREGVKVSCPYIAITDNIRDGGDVIAAYVASIGRGIGTVMRYGDMREDTIFCTEIAPTRRAKSGTEWDVILRYEPPESQEPQNQDGPNGPTDEPTEWFWDIDVQTVPVQVPVWKAWNYDAFPLGGAADGYERAADTHGPVVNSAGVVLDPPLMVDVYDTVYRLGGVATDYVPEWIDAFLNHINSGIMEFKQEFRATYGVMNRTFWQYTILCTAANASHFRQNGINYWRYTYELRFRERQNPLLSSSISSGIYPFDGWLEQVLDRGLSRFADAGSPDGAGGQFASGDLESGMTKGAAIRGPLGERAGELVLLDGAGQPLDLSGGDQGDGVYFRWRKHPLADFKQFPFRIFQ